MTDHLDPIVEIRGNLLIIILHNSINPVVWQMDRPRFQSAAFDVLQRQSAFFVRFKPLEGASTDIAEYSDRADALAVLKLIQQVLTENSGKGLGKNLKMIVEKPRIQHIILAAASIGLFVVLSIILFQLVPPLSHDHVSTQVTGVTPNAEPGIPQSADAVFKSQEFR